MRKIVLCDDDAPSRRLWQIVLEESGRWRVIAVDSGPAAIETARREQPDLVLLDLMMPGMDGLETLAALRRDPATASLAVVVLTGSLRPGDWQRCSALGATAVQKPFDADELPRLCEGWLTAILEERAARRGGERSALVASAIGELRAEFSGELPERVKSLEALVHAVAGDSEDAAAVERARAAAHQLAGTAGTLGLLAVSKAARQLEEILSLMADGHTAALAGLLPALDRLLAAEPG
jgi:two-component system, OmpR family, alkaline phosphatase synthesis response regulator PhoP